MRADMNEHVAVKSPSGDGSYKAVKSPSGDGSYKAVFSLIGICAGALLLAGCGLAEPVTISEEPGILDIKGSVPEAKAWKLLIGDVEIGPGTEDEKGYVDLEVDPAFVREGIAAALKETGAFAAVTLDGEGKHDLALDVKIVSARAKFAGSNGYRLPWILVWSLFSSVAASYIADEVYEGELVAEVSIFDKHSTEPLWKDTVKETFQGALDHFQRGIGVWDFFVPGPHWCEADPAKLSDHLVPHLVRRLELTLARRFADEVPPPVVDVLVAVGTGASRGKTKPLAFKDAEAFAGAFAKRPGRVETKLLLGPEATEATLLAILEGCSRRKDVRIRDVTVYFSGPGSLVQGPANKAEAAVVLAGGTHLKVSRMLELIASIPAESRVLVLDAGFRGKLGKVHAGPLVKLPPATEIAPFPAGKGRPALFSACGPGESAFESEELGGGVFTRLLLSKLSREGDTDKDGRVSCGEVFPMLGWAVMREARFAGSESTPFLSGDGVLFRYPLPAGKPEKKGGKK